MSSSASRQVELARLAHCGDPGAECGDLPLGELIFPTTLAIVVNVFTEPRERTAAIGIWTAIAGVGVALGPISGGWLREHFSWGSVFLVNVPVALVGIVGTMV